MDRIVDISTDGLHLAAHRGFLTVSASGEERGRIALDDVGALIVHAHGTTWSNALIMRLSERAVPVVMCGTNHAPVACLWPLEGHHAQAARMRAQIAAPRPFAKQAWAQIVSAKIRMQGEVLACTGREGGAFEMLARNVRSGDPANVEAQAARRYWKALFGPRFSRDRDAGGVNGLLNYGYAVLRALVSRAICGSGLHPTLGIFHSNRANAFALADDLMEPFRPVVDLLVMRLTETGCAEVSPEAKADLAKLPSVDLLMPDATVSPLGIAARNSRSRWPTPTSGEGLGSSCRCVPRRAWLQRRTADGGSGAARKYGTVTAEWVQADVDVGDFRPAGGDEGAACRSDEVPSASA